MISVSSRNSCSSCKSCPDCHPRPADGAAVPRRSAASLATIASLMRRQASGLISALHTTVGKSRIARASRIGDCSVPFTGRLRSASSEAMPPTPGGRPAVPSLYQCRSIAGRYSTSRSPATAFRWSGRDLLAFSPRAVTHEPKGPGPGLSAAFATAFACAIPGSWCGSGRRAYRTPPRSPTSRSRRGVTSMPG